MKNLRAGFSLLEMVVVVFLTALIVAAMVRFWPVVNSYFRRAQVQNQLNTDARTAMDTITHAVREGMANSIVICSCGSNPCYSTNWKLGTGACTPPSGTNVSVVPNNRIEYISYPNPSQRFAIFLKGNTVFMAQFATTDYNQSQNLNIFTHPLATNVTSLMFTGDYRDPSVINVSLRMDASVDAAHTSTVIFPNQTVRLEGTAWSSF